MNLVEEDFWDRLGEKDPDSFGLHLEMRERWASDKASLNFDNICGVSGEVGRLLLSGYVLGYVSCRRNQKERVEE